MDSRSVEQEQLADEVQETISPQEWHALISFNTYCATKLGLVLEFYRHPRGHASYRFRPRTPEERREWAEEWAEDHL